MKYINYFTTHAEYVSYQGSDDWIIPNLSFCELEDDLHLNPWSDPRIIAKFNVTDTTNPTSLFNNPSLLKELEIDGVKYTDNDIFSHYYYQFDTIGIHTVKYTLVDGTTSIDGSSFAGKSNMISITIPNTITTIGSSAFGGCIGLTSVPIPNSVTTIIGSPFQGCISLTSVTIPSSVTTISGSIGNLDFEDVIFESINPNATFMVDTINKCIISNNGTVLLVGFNNTVAISNTVTSIANYAFGWCYGLTSITIPNSVTSIGNNVFFGCSSLASVTVEATTPPTLGNGAFSEKASGRKIYVPSASVDTYKAASRWSNYASDIEAIP